jgi:[acyl-carrier-protein] S-malonyltransferase
MTKTLYAFPGQGSQYSGMAKDWCDSFKESAQAFEEASDGSGLNLKKLCFEGSDSDLKQTEVTQPAILTATIAIVRALKKEFGLGNALSLCAGHSLGEYSALVAADSLSLIEAAKLVRHRGQYMQSAVPAGKGSMAALIFKPGTEGAALAEALCKLVSANLGRALSVANFNSPEQIVISGDALAVQKAMELATQAPTGARKAVELPVSAPFHCDMMKPAAEKLAPELKAAQYKVSQVTYIANVDACLHSLGNQDALAQVADRLTSQIYMGVRWTDSVRLAITQGCTRLIEIGPGKVLTGLAKRISNNGQSLEAFSIDRFDQFTTEFKNAGLKF